MMPTATVLSLGRITIPAEIRKRLNLQPGSKVEIFQNEEGETVIRAKVEAVTK
jgi:AbrB family looped-hinge helix DNA binding protein